MFEAVIWGPPVAKKETRCKCIYGRPHLYDASSISKKKITKIFQLIALQCGIPPYHEPVKVISYAYIPMPKNISKKLYEKMKSGEIRPDKRPDLDNYIYHIANIASGIFYDDDKRICECHHYKFYDDCNGPRLIFKVEPLKTKNRGINEH